MSIRKNGPASSQKFRFEPEKNLDIIVENEVGHRSELLKMESGENENKVATENNFNAAVLESQIAAEVARENNLVQALGFKKNSPC